MKLNEVTIQTMKLFSQLNSNLFVEPGNVLKSVNEAQTCFSKAKVEDTFPIEFGIYDLQEFLSITNLIGSIDTIDFDFSSGNGKYVLISNEASTTKVKYWFASKKVLRYPEKDIKMPEPQATFVLPGNALSKLKRAAQTFGHPSVAVSCDGVSTEIIATAIDPEVQSASTFEISVGELETAGTSFNYIFSMQNLKYLPDVADSVFNVGLASKGQAKIAQFASGDLEYFIAVDSQSTITTSTGE